MKKSVLFCCLLTSVIMLAGCTHDDGAVLPAQNGNVGDSDTSATQKIAIESAFNTALKHAGLNADAVNFTKSNLELNDGVWEYEIEFTANAVEYEYTINAVSGEIVGFSSEKIAGQGGTGSGSGSSSQMAERITEDRALTIALSHAGLSANSIKLTKSQLEQDNGVWEYEIEFTANAVEYEYTINAVSGEIIDFSSEKINSQGGSGSNSGSQAGEQINEEQARYVALKHANLAANSVNFTKAKLEQDDGVWEYEIEFTANGVEYEYTINAVSGEIIEYSSEKIASQGTSSGSASSSQTVKHITEERALSIALSHAGVTANAVRLTKSQLDLDDGVWEYEIEFTANFREYEYTIDAVSGNIIEFSSESFSYSGGSGNSSNLPQGSARITEDMAKNLALKHAGFSSGAATFKEIKLEMDNGVWEYEIEFLAGGSEFEYKLDAVSGAVLEWEMDGYSHHCGDINCTHHPSYHHHH